MSIKYQNALKEIPFVEKIWIRSRTVFEFLK